MVYIYNSHRRGFDCLDKGICRFINISIGFLWSCGPVIIQLTWFKWLKQNIGNYRFIYINICYLWSCGPVDNTKK